MARASFKRMFANDVIGYESDESGADGEPVTPFTPLDREMCKLFRRDAMRNGQIVATVFDRLGSFRSTALDAVVSLL